MDREWAVLCGSVVTYCPRGIGVHTSSTFSDLGEALTLPIMSWQKFLKIMNSFLLCSVRDVVISSRERVTGFVACRDSPTGGKLPGLSSILICH